MNPRKQHENMREQSLLVKVHPYGQTQNTVIVVCKSHLTLMQQFLNIKVAMTIKVC